MRLHPLPLSPAHFLGKCRACTKCAQSRCAHKNVLLFPAKIVNFFPGGFGALYQKFGALLHFHTQLLQSHKAIRKMPGYKPTEAHISLPLQMCSEQKHSSASYAAHTYMLFHDLCVIYTLPLARSLLVLLASKKKRGVSAVTEPTHKTIAVDACPAPSPGLVIVPMVDGNNQALIPRQTRPGLGVTHVQIQLVSERHPERGLFQRGFAQTGSSMHGLEDLVKKIKKFHDGNAKF